jgi:hypothetical protein
VVTPLVIGMLILGSAAIALKAWPFFSRTGTVFRGGFIPAGRNRIYGYLLLVVAALLLSMIFLEIRC